MNGRNLHLNLPHTPTYGINSLSYFAANIWTQVSLEIKQCKSLSLFMQKIMKWIPEVCPCKLCKTYIHHVGYLRSEMLFLRILYLN